MFGAHAGVLAAAAGLAPDVIRVIDAFVDELERPRRAELLALHQHDHMRTMLEALDDGRPGDAWLIAGHCGYVEPLNLAVYLERDESAERLVRHVYRWQGARFLADALVKAVTRAVPLTTRALLEAGADANAMDDLQLTALALACRAGNEPAVQILMARRDVSLTACGVRRESMVVHAAFYSVRGHEYEDMKAARATAIRIAHRIIVDPRLDIDERTVDGESALQVVARWGMHEIVADLLQHPRIDPNARDVTQTTPLIAAARTCAWRAVKTLADDPRVDVDATDAEGHTALRRYVAACTGFAFPSTVDSEFLMRNIMSNTEKPFENIFIRGTDLRLKLDGNTPKTERGAALYR